MAGVVFRNYMYELCAAVIAGSASNTNSMQCKNYFGKVEKNLFKDMIIESLALKNIAFFKSTS